MKIVTWNVNSVRARFLHLTEWLATAQPDVVLLQEIKATDENFPLEALEELHYNVAFYGQKSYNGVAVLSKYPLEDVQKGIPNRTDPQARYIEAVTNGVRVASVYVPNGQRVGSDKFIYKLHFLEDLHHHLRQLLTYDESVVIGGDYNITVDDRDVYDPVGWREEVLCSTPERQALQRLLHLGYADALRSLYPSEILYSWWDYRQGSFQQNHGLRIDHLLVSPLAHDRLLEGGVEKSLRALPQASDHAPVWIQLS